MRSLLILLLPISLLLATGCRKHEGKPPAEIAAPKPSAAVKLTLLVVADAPLAGAAKLLRGEWAERSGGELEIQESSLQGLLEAEQLAANVVIYPSRHLGTLVSRGWLRPVRNMVLDDPEFAHSDILPLVRNRSMRYGGKVYALSMGEPPLLLGWHVSPPGEANTAVPFTWKKLDEFHPQMLDSSGLEFPLSAELLVRALAHTSALRQTALLFDTETMASRLTEVTFQRALTELVASRRGGAAEDSADFAMLTWPTAPVSPHAELSPEKIQLLRLPGAEKVFNESRGEWEPAQHSAPLAVLGFAGRSMSVTRSSRNAASAFKLLAWLGSEGPATHLSRQSRSTMWFRESQTERARQWLSELRLTSEPIDAITKLLSGSECFLLPRIPGIDEYLRALEETLQHTLDEELDADESLRATADQWNEITAKFGMDSQRVAYRRHLGLDDQQK